MWKAFSSYCTSATGQTHQLVTHGLYSTFRIFILGGFGSALELKFWLGNPFCVAAYAIASWKFFKDRIPFEETALAHMYGKKYEEYCGKLLLESHSSRRLIARPSSADAVQIRTRI